VKCTGKPDKDVILQQAHTPRQIVLEGQTLPMVQNTAKLNTVVTNGKL